MSESEVMETQKPKAKLGTFLRIIKTLFSYYPVLLPITAFCFIFTAAVSSIPPLFFQQVISVIQDSIHTGDWATAKPVILSRLSILALFICLL